MDANGVVVIATVPTVVVPLRVAGGRMWLGWINGLLSKIPLPNKPHVSYPILENAGTPSPVNTGQL